MPSQCITSDCNTLPFRRGVCRHHYDRWLKGDKAITPLPSRFAGTAFDRAALRLLARFEPLPSGCWQWQGTYMRHGYGSFSDGRKAMSAHRFSYLYFVGPIPSRYDVDHLCRNRGCINPDHLEAVPRSVNLLRGQLGTPKPRGFASPRAKLNPRQVEEIRNSTMPSRQIAPMYGVGASTVKRVRRHQTY